MNKNDENNTRHASIAAILASVGGFCSILAFMLTTKDIMDERNTLAISVISIIYTLVSLSTNMIKIAK
jgi:hypothetical protein